MIYEQATTEQIEAVMRNSRKAFLQYRNFSLEQRAAFMRCIAAEIQTLGDDLIEIAAQETNLPEARLKAERGRTIFQLTSYADACEKGDWLEVSIDTADLNRNPRLTGSVGQAPKPDLRKTKIPLGPVVVFGASNFPFAYSTAGGDTACAFAAGCSVVVKAHPAHAQTSEMVAAAIHSAVKKSHMPEGVFAHVHGASFEVGKALVMHPFTKAVGFTGSFAGGKALFDLANQRKEPIPVFAEMGSINPVFLFPEKLKQDAEAVAKMLAASITLSVGQFCTNPGLLIGMEGVDQLIATLSEEIKKYAPGKMLHEGIAKAYVEKRREALIQQGVETIAVSPGETEEGLPTIATASAEAFLKNPVLHHEVFGPYSLIIRCRNKVEMHQVVENLEGQLTTSVIATENELATHSNLVEAIKNICGRFIYNGVPTGVEPCFSMHHGGPFPATTDSRFTSVGADGIKRFAKPICYQNWPDEFLPIELKNRNPSGIWRRVNNELTNGRME